MPISYVIFVFIHQKQYDKLDRSGFYVIVHMPLIHYLILSIVLIVYVI